MRFLSMVADEIYHHKFHTCTTKPYTF